MVQFKLVDLARLQGVLNQGPLRQKDEPTFQVISQLIGAVKQVQETVNFNISTFSAGLNVSAGTSSRVLTQLIFSNQNSISFGLSSNKITASANPGILFSASGSSGRFTGLTFSNSNNITFGNSNGIVTASFSVATSAASISISAGTSTAALNSIVFSNSNGVSFGLSGSTITASISTANGNITLSAGTKTVAANSFVFSNNGNVSFGLTGSTVTATAGFQLSAGTTFGTVTDSLIFSNANGVSWGIAFNSVLTASINAVIAVTHSYFENLPAFQGIASVATNNASEMFFQPIVLPFNVTASYLRNVISQSFQNAINFGLTSANTAFTAAQYFTHAFVLYTLNTGASFNSLKSIYSTSAGRTLASSITNGTAGSRYTININISYNAQGATTLTFSGSTNFSSASYIYSSGVVSDFHSAVFFDFPFATSLPPGQYFLGFGMSTTSSNNGPAGAFSAGSAGYSSLMASQLGVQPKIMGATSQTDQLQPGIGRFSSNAAFLSTTGLDLSQITSRPNNNANLIQMIYRA